MVKHIILWKINEGKSVEEKQTIKENCKKELEGLMGQIPGLLSMHIQIESLPSSTADLMLEAAYDSVESLKGYGIHPKHVAVADTYVRPNMEVRMCLDFQV